VGKVLRNSGSGIVAEPIKAECDDMMSKESSDGQKLVANTTMKFQQLAAIADYEFVPLRSGTAGEFVTDSNFLIVSGSLTGAGYFDLQVNSGTDAAYWSNNKGIRCLLHSGDQVAPYDTKQQVLMHNIQFAETPNGEVSLVCAVAYNNY
jgi:hypothetical protein